jgi:hypothetical protein
MPFDNQGKPLRHVGDVNCSICGPRRGLRMCRACSDSYERYAHNDGAVIEAMVWAARRARRFAVARERLRQRLARTGLLRGTP